MYRLLIVDDEKEILEWLEELFIDRDLVGLDLEVYTATAGSKALELLDRVRFDIVLSDIKMPGINGLELFKRIKMNWPKCKVVFLTGYREFDYVYEVIQSQGVRYLLKTESDEVIISSIQEAIRDIEEELTNKEMLNRAQEQMEKYIFMIQKDYINQLLVEEISLEDTKRGIEEVRLPLSCDMSLLMIIGRFDSLRFDIALVEQYENYERLQMIVEENLSKEFTVIQHIHDVYYGIWLMQPKTIQEIEWPKIFNNLSGKMEYIQMACKKKIDLDISFAMSELPILLNEISGTYRRLKRQLVTYTSLGGQGILIKEQEIKEVGEMKKFYHGYEISNDLVHKVNLLEKCIELRKKEEYYDLLGELFKGFENLRNKYYGIALESYYNVAVMLLRFINTNNLNAKIAFHLGIYKLTRIDEHKDWIEAVNYLYEVSQTIFNVLGDNERVKSTDTVEKVIAYIQDNLGEDLSLIKLSEVVHFNPSYLSRLFRQVSGYKLSEYITKERIKKAKLLLEEDRLKVNEIAQKVGYESAHSFTRTFKTVEGIPPIEYKLLYFKR